MQQQNKLTSFPSLLSLLWVRGAKHPYVRIDRQLLKQTRLFDQQHCPLLRAGELLLSFLLGEARCCSSLPSYRCDSLTYNLNIILVAWPWLVSSKLEGGRDRIVHRKVLGGFLSSTQPLVWVKPTVNLPGWSP